MASDCCSYFRGQDVLDFRRQVSTIAEVWSFVDSSLKMTPFDRYDLLLAFHVITYNYMSCLVLLSRYSAILITSFAGAVAKYCGQYVCVSDVCVDCVCLSTRISPEQHTRSLPNFLRMLPMTLAQSSSGVVAIRYVLPVFWMTCTFSFYNGPYSGMNFATKDRFRLNILFTAKSERI